MRKLGLDLRLAILGRRRHIQRDSPHDRTVLAEKIYISIAFSVRMGVDDHKPVST
jgi:hypothetical protein